MAKYHPTLRVNTLSHPDGSSFSPLFTDGIAIEEAASAATGILNINSTTGELQTNDQGTTRPLMALPAAVDNLNTVTTAVIATVWTQLTSVSLGADYDHKVDLTAADFDLGATQDGYWIVNIDHTATSATHFAYGVETGEPLWNFPVNPVTSQLRTVLLLPGKNASESGFEIWAWASHTGTATITANWVGIRNEISNSIS